MKTLIALVAALVLVGCSERRQEAQNQPYGTAPYDTYCLQQGYQDPSRCQGVYGYPSGYNYNYWQPYQTYNYGGYNYWYGWNNGSYNGCGNGYAPTYSNWGLACYRYNPSVNYYWWAYGSGSTYGGYNGYNYGGFLIACGRDWSGVCPTGTYCTDASGFGVCAY